MNTFTDIWETLDWYSIRDQIQSKNNLDVESALQSTSPTINDFMALISPAAKQYLEPLAQRAQQLTRQRFGYAVNFYLPLYLSNLCSNDCTYCGFSMSNKLKRKVLTDDEILQECQAIKDLGYHSLLLVTGEHENKVGFKYFERIFQLIRPLFSTLMLEIQPLSTNEYSNLKTLGLDGVMVYQESYHLPTYDKSHKHGKKRDFHWRLQTQDRLGTANIDKIGLGVLNGLSHDWRADNYFLAVHLIYLQQKYWQSRYSISFPRLRPCAGGIQPQSIMDETDLLQLICAFRLLSPDVELSLSTRESPYFRDNVIPIAINQVSAYSKTQPGGYANPTPHLEQFSPGDNRTPQAVANALKKSGLQPIWKDWDHYQ